MLCVSLGVSLGVGLGVSLGVSIGLSIGEDLDGSIGVNLSGNMGENRKMGWSPNCLIGNVLISAYISFSCKHSGFTNCQFRYTYTATKSCSNLYCKKSWRMIFFNHNLGDIFGWAIQFDECATQIGECASQIEEVR